MGDWTYCEYCFQNAPDRMPVVSERGAELRLLRDILRRCEPTTNEENWAAHHLFRRRYPKEWREVEKRFMVQDASYKRRPPLFRTARVAACRVLCAATVVFRSAMENEVLAAGERHQSQRSMGRWVFARWFRLQETRPQQPFHKRRRLDAWRSAVAEDHAQIIYYKWN